LVVDDFDGVVRLVGEVGGDGPGEAAVVGDAGWENVSYVISSLLEGFGCGNGDCDRVVRVNLGYDCDWD
jgi:hypothetical protein